MANLEITMNTSRRRFLKTTSGAALAAPALTRAANLNSKGQHACIGVGGMGYNDLKNFLSHKKTEVVAICDVDSKRLATAAKLAPEARTYSDWRELLAKEGDKVDSVNVTVPDHMHFPISYSAVTAGNHVYCQKPLCHDVAEVRLLTEAARKAGVKTQLGTQAASGFGDRTFIQHIKSGVIGKIKRVVLCSNRPGAIEAYRFVGPRPKEPQQAPEHLNWDLWIGSAPMRPYAPSIYHPGKWRSWLDFGTGWSGDIGCHVFDATWKALGLTVPKTILAKVQESWKKSKIRQGDTWPQSDHITWTFPGTKMTEKDEVTVEWFDGLMYPAEDVQAVYPGKPYPPESAMVIGTKGAMILPNGQMPILLPKESFKEVRPPKLDPRNHYHHFCDAIHGDAKNESYFEQTGPMTEAILLGTVAIRNPDTLLEWDAKKLAIPNSADANKMLRRKYREGWSVGGF